MRNFNWVTIPKQSVVGKRNIWTVQKSTEEFQLDTKRMEELFSQGGPGQQQKQASSRSSVRGLPSSAQGGEPVSILQAKKSMNIGIFLKQFKRPVREMVEDISQGNGESFGRGKLKDMFKLLPEDGEVKQLLAYKGDLSLLSEADLFMALLVRVPGYEERLRSLVLREEFSPFMDEMKQSIATMTTAARELLDCDDLHSIIRLVLKTGNYMNAGGYAGSAIGFKMASLLKLVDTKANKPGMNLMHYVVMQAHKIDGDLLNFPDQLQHIGTAARIQKQEVEADFQREKRKVEEAQKNARKQPDLEAQMKLFLEEAEMQLAEVEASFQSLNAVNLLVAEYFCEDPNQFKLEECCTIFDSFCQKFIRAIQENREREIAEEVKRRRRERVHSSVKRRSTATCSIQDKDMEGGALESILQRFVSNRGSQRRAGTPSPTSSNVAKIAIKENSLREEPEVANGSPAMEAQKNERNLAKEQTKSCILEEVQPAPSDKAEKRESIVKEQEPLVTMDSPQNLNQKCLETPSRKNSCVSSTERHKSVKSEEEEEGQNEEEAQKMREVSRKVLRYQGSRGSISSGDHSIGDHPRTPKSGSSLGSPRSQKFSMDLPANGVPRTILSPRFTPRMTSTSLSRRHTLSIPPKSDSQEDDLWMLPKVSGHHPHLGALGKLRSADNMLSKVEEIHGRKTSPSPADGSSKPRGLSVRPSDLANRTSPTTRSDTFRKQNSPGRQTSAKGQEESQKEGKTLELAPSFQFGSLFQRRSNSQSAKAKAEEQATPEEKAKPKKQETSVFFSLFKLFSEKNRPNKEMDSRSTEC
ncbi:inverted formin-2 isoform X2 [Conger conger]|nr:inverted formin-2 isoform X2 [Conger conger]